MAPSNELCSLESLRCEAKFDLIPGEYGEVGDDARPAAEVPGQPACPLGRPDVELRGFSSAYGEFRSTRDSIALVEMEVRGACRL